MLSGWRASDHLVHANRRADGQPVLQIEMDITHSVQLFYIHQVLVRPDAVAHAHENIRPAHKGARLIRIVRQELARIFERFGDDVIELR